MKNIILLVSYLILAITLGCNKSTDKKVTTTKPTFVKGQYYQGGVIFYVDGTGKHGLIASGITSIQQSSWGCYGALIPNANGVSVGTGQANTTSICKACSEWGVARQCNEWAAGGYNDWFLPSIDELKLMYELRVEIGDFNDGDYWSSTQKDSNNAMVLSFFKGEKFSIEKRSGANLMSIRAF